MIDSLKTVILHAQQWSFGTEIATRRRIWTKLSKLLSSGVKIRDALDSIRARRLQSVGQYDASVIAIDQWMRRIQNGQRFADAIADWVPSQERMLLAAGERSGRLQEALISCAKVMVVQREIKKAIRNGLVYPVLLVVGVFVMMWFFGNHIIPSFSKIIPVDKWRGVAATVVHVSHWIQHWFWLPVVMLLALSGAIAWMLPNWVGASRATLDRYPPFSIYRTVLGSSWMISLAAMVGAGERMEDAMHSMGKYGNPWLKTRTEEILRGLRSGLPLGDAMARTGSGFPDREIIDDLGVYASTSGLDESLRIIADEWIAESVANIQLMMKVVFNVGILVSAGMVGFMVSGLIAMQLQMGQILRHGGV